MTRILFVCLGNICRSPAAEGVFRKLADEARLDVEIDSAGTGDWHVGEPPHPPMQAAAKSRGYDLSAQRARQVQPDDFSTFDMILAMDRANLVALNKTRPARASIDPRLFMSFAPNASSREVPDPYYSQNYDHALDLIENGCRGLISHLHKR